MYQSVCSVINAFFYITPTGEDTATCVNCHHPFVFNEDLFLHHKAWFEAKKPKTSVWTFYVPKYQCAVS